MLVTLLSWIYIFFVCLLVGTGVAGVFKEKKFPLTYYLITGIMAITVYVECFSIIGKIGCLAHLLMLAAALALGLIQRKKLTELWKEYFSVVCSWEGFFYLCFVIFIAFFASRGIFHTDTNIYHAQAIRLYEEYGLIKGMGNLQLHFAYNSAYLAFASIFSLNWLFGQSLHTTTGFVEVMMCIYAFHGLKNFKNHKSHIADMMRVGILFYTLVILTGSMSPATDYTTMFLVLFVITAWCENMEKERDVTIYSLLAVTAVFVVTLKFSACLLVLIVIYPAIFLVREKRWKEIGAYLGSGFLLVLPFLIRNYLISGWLLYPFNGIDIFNVEWKIPEAYLLVDANQIKVWGRCLYDVNKIDWGVAQWFPIWWEGQERYEQMLLGAVLIGIFLLLVQFVSKLIGHRKIRWDLFVLVMTVFGCLAVWFLTAPFIRYGVAFLFALPMIAVGNYLSEQKKGFYSILTGGLVFCIVMSVSPYWDHYITDAGVFIKQNLTQPYYIWQKDYDKAQEESYEINGNTVYYSVDGEINTYYTYPGTCYEFMLERSTLMGDEIKDGFKAK
ncbi:MAG: hypothetical protein PUC12_07705 [Clostridiales bacterium]|nr:hypothetical protein [Clostridiales bacterium]